MENRRVVTFYEAAYLVACDKEVLIKPDGQKTRLTVEDTPLIDGLLALFSGNADIQKMVKGIVDFRRQFKDYRIEQRKTNNQEKAVEVNPDPPEKDGHS